MTFGSGGRFGVVPDFGARVRGLRAHCVGVVSRCGESGRIAR